ncbi:MAG: alpha/beta fold hydrolase [Planctomycetota bacterium]
MRLGELEIEADGGVTLFVRDFHPDEQTVPAGDSPRTIIWLHGLGEHGGRYLHFAEDLVERGWRVILPDLRGHGRSTGTRTHVASFDEYVEDMARVWTRFELGAGQAVLGSHSMGGLVALRAVQRDRVQPSALVLSSPLLGVKVRVSRIKRFLGRALVRIFPKTRFRNGLDPRNMTSDEEFARQRREDPLIVRTVTASWFFAMETAVAQARRDASRITIPVLALQGLSDLTTDGDVLANWLAQTNSDVRDLVSLPDHVHELLHETDWHETLVRILEWLERTGAARV